MVDKHLPAFGRSNQPLNIPKSAWLVNLVGSIGTFFAFLYFDPEPSLLLASSAALNVGLMLTIIFQLYQWNLLLSPFASVVIGPGWVIIYSVGNLGARIAGEGRYGSNPGSLEFYPLAAFLSTIGLVVFYLVGFVLLGRQARYYRITYQDLTWQPWQALVASLIATGILTYLSSRYTFSNGYFLDVQGQLDRGLAATHYFFVILAAVMGVSVFLKASRNWDRLFGLSGILLPIVTALGLRSRTFMVAVIVTIVICWITLRPRHAWRAVFAGLIAALILFSLGTLVKTASVHGETNSIIGNLVTVYNSDWQSLTGTNTSSFQIDYQYRMAGFEHPAAILFSLSRGVSPMYGEGIIAAMISGLPSMIRPQGIFSERNAIFRHFYGRGLYYGDSIGIPLTSGLADWGILLGPLIYAVIALYCLLVWRIVQISPSLFLAYLIVGAGPGYLFWENAFFAIRAIAFAWFVLIILSPLTLPMRRRSVPPVARKHLPEVSHIPNRPGSL